MKKEQTKWIAAPMSGGKGWDTLGAIAGGNVEREEDPLGLQFKTYTSFKGRNVKKKKGNCVLEPFGHTWGANTSKKNNQGKNCLAQLWGKYTMEPIGVKVKRMERYRERGKKESWKYWLEEWGV